MKNINRYKNIVYSECHYKQSYPLSKLTSVVLKRYNAAQDGPVSNDFSPTL